MDRRALLLGGAAFLGSATVVGAAALTYGAVSAANKQTDQFLIMRSDAEWRSMLTKLEYKVMREESTERAGSSLLHRETSEGIYYCKGCNLQLYSSTAKFQSGTGWPSFYESLPNAVGTKEERSFFSSRTEVHCRRCGSHLGHLFEDGPPPTGLRYSLNGASLKFVPDSEADMILRKRSRRVVKV